MTSMMMEDEQGEDDDGDEMVCTATVASFGTLCVEAALPSAPVSLMSLGYKKAQYKDVG